jgi:hypothetical protein
LSQVADVQVFASLHWSQVPPVIWMFVQSGGGEVVGADDVSAVQVPSEPPV